MIKKNNKNTNSIDGIYYACIDKDDYKSYGVDLDELEFYKTIKEVNANTWLDENERVILKFRIEQLETPHICNCEHCCIDKKGKTNKIKF